MSRTNDFSVLIGLDWASSKHDVCIQYADGTRELAVVKHSAEAIEQWITELHQQHPGQIAIALELSKGPIVYALQKYSFVTIRDLRQKLLGHDWLRTFLCECLNDYIGIRIILRDSEN